MRQAASGAGEPTVNVTSNRAPALWMGTLLLASASAFLSACGPQDGSSAAMAAPTPVATLATAPAAAATPQPTPEQVAPAAAPPAPVAKPAPVKVAQPAPVAKPAPIKVAAAPPSNTVGAVRQIDEITEAHASGVGAVAGGVLGGVVGHQFGKGNGKKAMTVLGAVGGAVAGHQVEKATTAKVVGYRVQVQLDNGETRTFEPAQLDGLKVGDRVRVEHGLLRRA